MLDLNKDIISIDPSDETNNKDNSSSSNNKTLSYFHKLPERSVTNSGTSSSSIINLEELPNNDHNSSDVHNKPAFIFDILKKDHAGKDNCLISFPVIGKQPELCSGSMSMSKPPWLKLSCAEGSSSVQPELMKVVKPKKSRRGPRSRSSQYRGVTFYRRTGRWESHIWDCGKQVYLGGFDTAHAAARAYDRAAIKFRGVDADINFELSDYEEDMKQTKNLGKGEFVQILRRQSNGFLKGGSKYRGMNLQNGLLEARMGQFLGKKVSDKAAIECIGREAVTNFRPNAYEREMIVGKKARGSEHNLDLSLGLSASSNSPDQHFGSTVNVSASAHVGGKELRGPQLASMPPMCPGIYPGLLPNYTGREVEKKIEGSPSTKLSSFAWQMHNQDGNYPTPLLSNAASSGFPSSSMTIPPNPQSFSIIQLQHLKPRS